MIHDEFLEKYLIAWLSKKNTKTNKPEKEFSKLREQYEQRTSGKPVIDCIKGCGYYLPIGLIGSKLEGRVETWGMRSGKKVMAKLIDYELCDDPHDMVRESRWQYIGYVGEKPFAEMTWEEYLELFKKQHS